MWSEEDNQADVDPARAGFFIGVAPPNELGDFVQIATPDMASKSLKRSAS
jgi:hypothetical protein